MSLNEKLLDDLKEAMKTKNAPRLSCLRMLKTALKNKQVEKGSPLDDREFEAVVSSMVRKGRESIEEFTKAGRLDLVQKESAEIEILHQYLPEQLTEEQIEEVVREVITEVGASSPKDLGRVMKSAMERLAGKAQGKDVNQAAKKLLS
ncbi:MAG TPA: GatB/YqeY domain-containing protein [Desulfobacteraceae bacterium]|nr:GatB/YqeY domain-containing protein [Desulfobacteraceae bacterium]